MKYWQMKITVNKLLVFFIAKINREISHIIYDKLFSFWQFFGFFIIKNHFYQPIPDTRTVSSARWDRPSELIGININDESQLRLLASFSSAYKHEYDKFPIEKNQILHPYDYYVNNNQFESVDGYVLYCMIRHFKPARIIEIGSGNSTYLSAQAVQKNKESGHSCKLIAIEPYPNDILKMGFPGLSNLVPSKVESIQLTEFTKLKENDILFIDSSHVLKIGSDVQYEILDILPRLKKGVLIHFHDIFLPSEYPKDWVLNRHSFFTEQYLLQAFLTFNDYYEIIWAGQYMHLWHSDELEKAFYTYKKELRCPGSFWIRKVK